MLPDIPLRRIDVIIPCQSRHPIPLRRSLESSSAYNIVGPSINQLGITKYILLVLHRWSSDHVRFRRIFEVLPFGTKIVIENIAFNIKDVRVRFVPNLQFESQLSSSATLRQMWNIPDHSWPPVIDLRRLRHSAQIHDSVSIVQIPDRHGPTNYIFKASLRRLKYVYHELKLLLTMRPHPNIIPKPLYIVSTANPRTNHDDILGFVLEYHSSGNLGDALSTHPLRFQVNPNIRFRWARQIIHTLEAIISNAARFYSELKPENLLLSQHTDDLVFIDFEQSGNWDTFSPPEIFYTEQMMKLAISDVVPEEARKRYELSLRSILPNIIDQQNTYSNPIGGYYDAWTALSSDQQEAAMVFMVGKLLWCIFEGCSHTRNSLDERYHTKVEVFFPDFKKTPLGLQNLIKLCTMGAPEWDLGVIEVVRDGSTFFEKTISTKDQVSGSPAAAMNAAMEMWGHRVRKMEAYFAARIRWIKGIASDKDESILGFPQRPKLKRVLTLLLQEENKANGSSD